MKTSGSPALLARLSGGKPGRAALVLVAAHMAVVALAWLCWAAGLPPAFDHLRVLKGIVVGVVGIGGLVALMLVFGFWGVAANGFQDGGEDYERSFGGLGAVGLGWLRWALQLLAAGGVMLALFMAIEHGRWWQVHGTPEIDGLPALAHSLTPPAGWALEEAQRGQYDDDSPYPHASYELRFGVPGQPSERHIREWLQGPGMAPLGKVVVDECTSAPPACHAHAVPASGDEPEYTVRVRFHSASDVNVRLVYEKQH